MNATQKNVRTTGPKIRRVRTFTTGFGALAAATALSLSAVPAQAATTDVSTGHIDFVSVAANGNGLKVGSNLEDTGWKPAGTYALKVKKTNGASGNGYIIPETQGEAETRGVPFAGFSGDEDLFDSPLNYGNSDSVSVKLDSVGFTPKSGTSGTGTVTISQSGTTWFDSAGDSHRFVTDGDEESFHEHAKWVFSKAGTYKLKFSATGSKGQVAPVQTYTVKVGL